MLRPSRQFKKIQNDNHQVQHLGGATRFFVDSVGYRHVFGTSAPPIALDSLTDTHSVIRAIEKAILYAMQMIA
jgi:hypothetical protein